MYFSSTAFIEFTADCHALLLGIFVVSLAYIDPPVGSTSEYNGSADKAGSTYPPFNAAKIYSHSLLSRMSLIVSSINSKS